MIKAIAKYIGVFNSSLMVNEEIKRSRKDALNKWSESSEASFEFMQIPFEKKWISLTRATYKLLQ